MNEYLKNKPYRALINADVLSGIGDSLFNIVFIIYASTVPNHKLAVSLASIATVFPALLSVITGTFADRTKRKTHAMILTRTFQGLLFVVLSVLIGFQKSMPLFIILLLINIISDTAGTYGTGLSYPLLGRIVKPEHLDSAMGLVSASSTMVQIVFEGLGAVLIVALSYKYWLFGVINAISFLLAASSIFFSRKDLMAAERKNDQLEDAETAQEDGSQDFKSSLKEALAFIVQNNFLLIFIIFAAVINFFGASMSGLINVSLLSYKELYLGNYGNSVAILNIVFSVGIILGSLLMNDLLKNMKMFGLLSLCNAFLALLGIGFIWHKSLIVVACFYFLSGYMAGKINPKLSSMIIQIVPGDKIGAINGFVQMVCLLAAPVGQVLFLTLANTVSVTLSWEIFTGCAALAVVASLVLLFKVKQPKLAEH